MTGLSVIICTHNPRPDYLRRVLAALQAQTLPQARWELLLIDNASRAVLGEAWDLSWHVCASHIREEELGLTPARLRGIAEARGDLLVFVDDDNVLDEDFLEVAEEIGRTYPFLGTWGGSVIAEFEKPPPEWTRPLWPNLAIRSFDIVRWSNTLDDWNAQPFGAGLCVRAPVARYYAREVSVHPIRRRLDRRGDELTGAGDTDIVFTSRKLGLGWGTFPNLKLKHLLPKERLDESYLLRLIEGTATSVAVLQLQKGESVVVTSNWKVIIRFLWIFIRRGRRESRFYLARKRGTARAIAWIAAV